MTSTQGPGTSRDGGPGPVRLLPAPGRAVRLPDPDPDQRRVVDLRQGSGPLVVLGAPGTGKTTVLVQALLERVRRDGVRADGMLVLAPTRTAAADLRDRISAGLERTASEPAARTPHSYAFDLLRRSRLRDGLPAPRLLSGPEQDSVLGELLAGHAEGLGRVPAWPEEIDESVRALRGFREELRDLLMRAVERGLGPPDLRRLGREHRREQWTAAATVFEEYLQVTALSTPGALDPAGIVDAATRLLASDPRLLAAERSRRVLVAVDDAQELTAAAHRLVGLLVAGGGDVLLVGDPDATTQGFRGALPRGLAQAPHALRGADGAPARTVVLGTSHRHPPALRAVCERVCSRIGSTGQVAHRRPVPGRRGPGGGCTVQVRVLPTAAQEGACVAQALRRHHLQGGVPWGRMAVVVRSARDTRALRRALAAAGVPVVIPVAQLPVRDEPAVVPLLLALRCCLDPRALTGQAAVRLLTGPIGGADALGLRRLRRVLRDEELAGGGARGSDELLVEALADPGRLLTPDQPTVAPAQRVARVLLAGRRAAGEPDATAETVLWALWQDCGLAAPWHARALGGRSGADRADRDLDAVVALFEAAARFVDRLPKAGPRAFLDHLEGQDLPSDTLAERAPSGDCVTLVTANGAAGLQWQVVVVAGVQEGLWPNLRPRSSLLGAADLADLLDGRWDGPATAPAARRRAVLDEELRLFHVAVARASEHLLVTAVRSEDLLPSPFLDLVDPAQDRDGRPVDTAPRTLSLPALVAELRAAVCSPDTGQGPDGTEGHEGAERRARAAVQLARLALAGVRGADPREWYGLAGPSVSGDLRPGDGPVRVSPSRVEVFERCPLRWLLEETGGRTGRTTAQGLGTLVHEIAQEVPDAREDRMLELLAERFGRLGLGTGWVADRERARAEGMLRKLAGYVRDSRAAGRRLAAVERQVRIQVGRAAVRGQVDRLEVDGDGNAVVVDLKTGRTVPTVAEAARHAQLGVYQVAAQEGAFADDAGEHARSGGAALVHLGTDSGSAPVRHQDPVDRAEDPRWAHRLLARSAEGMAGADFPAAVGQHCRACGLAQCCPARTEGRQVGR